MHSYDHISSQKEISCALRSDLDAERRRGELKSEFVESPPIRISATMLPSNKPPGGLV